MTSLKVLAGRPAFGATAPRLLHLQRRWAQVHDVRFLVTHQQNARVVEKYKDKLQQKAKESVMMMQVSAIHRLIARAGKVSRMLTS